MSEWQPIETAPKDGTAILVYFPWGNHVSYGAYVTAEWSIFNGEGYWSLCESGERSIDDSVPRAPTHWMPLPPPPK